LPEESPSSIVNLDSRNSECRPDVPPPPPPTVTPDDNELPGIDAILAAEFDDEVVGNLEVKREERRRELAQDPVVGSLVSFEFDKPILLLFMFLAFKDEVSVVSMLVNKEFDLELLRVNFEVFPLVVLRVAFLTFLALTDDEAE